MDYRTNTQDVYIIEQTEVRNVSGDCAGRKCDRKYVTRL